MSEISRARTGNGRLITIEDIQRIQGVDFETAKREFDFVRSAQHKDSDDLLVHQYCNFRSPNFNEIIVYLGSFSRSFNYPSFLKS